MYKFKLFSKDRFEGKTDEEILDMDKEKRINPKRTVRKTSKSIGALVGAGAGLISSLTRKEGSKSIIPFRKSKGLDGHGILGNMTDAAIRTGIGAMAGRGVGSLVGGLANSSVDSISKNASRTVQRLEDDNRKLKASRYSDDSEGSEDSEYVTPREIIERGRNAVRGISPISKAALSAGAGALAGGLVARSAGNSFKKGAAVSGILGGVGSYAYQIHKRNAEINERNRELQKEKRAARRRQWDKE